MEFGKDFDSEVRLPNSFAFRFFWELIISKLLEEFEMLEELELFEELEMFEKFKLIEELEQFAELGWSMVLKLVATVLLLGHLTPLIDWFTLASILTCLLYVE